MVSWRFRWFILLLMIVGQLQIPLRAQSTNEWRITGFPHYPIKGRLTGYGYLGWVNNPGAEYSLWYGGYPGFVYTPKSWFQIWGGQIMIYTDNYTNVSGKQDKLELRPYIAPKFFLPNKWRWNIYNMDRLEFRQTYDHGTHEWTNVERWRFRFGIEAPLTNRENAWKVKTFYALVNTEPMYRFDKSDIDPYRVQAGLGYVANPRVRAELLYYANWGRVAPGNDLEFTQNIIRLNVKVAVKRALLSHVWNPAEREE